MKYGLLEVGEITRKGDQLFSSISCRWLPIKKDEIDWPIKPGWLPVRRKLCPGATLATAGAEWHKANSTTN